MIQVLESTKKTQNVEVFDFDNFVDERKIHRYNDLVKDQKYKNSFDQNYLSLLKSIDQNLNFKIGSIVNGKIVSISKKDLLIDCNYKDNVTVDIKATDQLMISRLSVNDNISVIITEVNNKPFSIKGSITDLLKLNLSEKIKDFFTNKTAVEAYVKESIPAGFMMEITIDNLNIDAFMPNTLADVNRIHNPESLVGETVKVVFESLQQEKGIYVVNRRKYLTTLIADKIKEIKKQPKDKEYSGFVTGTTPFGVFVQFNGCLTGMVHKYNISEAYRDKLHEIKPGTPIDFYVKEIIKNDKQIILSQFLKDSLWDNIKVDEIYNGKVIASILDRKPNGILVELDHETNGLIQNTFLVRNNREVKIGERIDVRVISIYKDERKIYLTFADDASYDIDRENNIKKLKERYNN